MIAIDKILHTLPGRTRLKINTDLPPAVVEFTLRKVPCLYSANYTVETNSVLLYHTSHLTVKELIRSIVQQLQHDGMLQLTRKPIEYNKLRVFYGASAFMLDFLFRPTFIRQGFVGKVFNIPAMSALLLSTDILKSGIGSIVKERRANGDTLTSSAILASILKGNPKSALLILIMGSISELITDYTANRTRNHVSHMLSLDIPFVWKVNEEGNETKVPIEKIKREDFIAVFHGEKIPIDGEVVEGVGSVDASSITGEFLPKEVVKGDHIFAGSILKEGQLKIKVEKVGEETAVKKMIHLIEDAQNRKAPIQSLADRVSEQLVPISFLMAGLVYLTTRSWSRVLSMLTIDFVCGIKLSTATAFSAAVGQAAKKGILVKGGQYIEKLAQTDTVLLDKTGTITEGRPIVTKIRAFNGFSENEVINYAASAEEHSSHPIAEAVINKSKENEDPIPEHEHDKIVNVVGRGVRAIINKKSMIVGNSKFMEESDVSLSVFENDEDSIKPGENVIYVAYDKQLIGIITIEDKVRRGMEETVQRLRQQGINELVMITGDKKHAARAISRRIGLDSYWTEALPKDKAEFVKSYRRKKNIVMMVGDGINDAPALAYADVGVTMGAKRTDIAVEASDVTIASDDPKTIPNVVHLSKHTMKIVHQNLIITLLLNSSAILLGAVGAISPIVGAGIHNGATIFTVFNSARIIFGGDRLNESPN